MRDCLNCIHHTDNGCTVWDCSFVRKAGGTKGIILNKILTDAEYLAEGFLPEELADIRRSDILFNKGKLEGWTPVEATEYYGLVEKLGI